MKAVMAGKPLTGLLLVCLLACFATSSSLKQEETFNENVKNQLKEDNPSSLYESNASPKFHEKPRSRIRQPRSDASPSINEAVVDQLIQRVGQLSASVDSLTHQVLTFGTHTEALQNNISELQSKNVALSVELGQAAQTIQQQTTALEATLAQFAAFRREVSQASQAQNKTLSQMSQAFQAQNKTLSQTIIDTAGINTKLGRVEGSQNLTGSKLLVHDQKLAEFDQRMASLERRTNHAEKDTEILEHWKANVTDDVTKIKVTQAQHVNDVHTLEEGGRLVEFDQRITSLERRTNHTEKDTEILEHWKANVTDDVTKITVTQAQLVNDVHKLEEGGRQVLGVSSQLQTDLSQLQAKFAFSTQQVVFYARLSHNTKPPVPRPPFPITVLGEVLTNQGDAYNATSGNFTVPVDGYYFFAAKSVAPLSGSHGAPVIELMVDEDRVSLTNAYHPNVEAALRLQAGQRVWLRSFFSSTFGRGMYFTGYLINPVLN